MGAHDALLGTRLFGFAVLFRARPKGAGFEALPTTAADAASELAGELEHIGQEQVPLFSSGPDEVGVSVPFGRCGIAGRPLEHVRVLHAEAAWLDRLTPDGTTSRAVAPGETVLVEPGGFVRFRARPRPGRRVLVAFQTEDRSPLAGHAAALTLAGETVPAEAGERLRQTSAAFAALQAAPAAARARLQARLTEMAAAVAAEPAVAAAQDAARAAGSYEAGGDEALFARAAELLSPAVLARVRAADPQLFRFPGMFGAVAPLFSLLDA